MEKPYSCCLLAAWPPLIAPIATEYLPDLRTKRAAFLLCVFADRVLGLVGSTSSRAPAEMRSWHRERDAAGVNADGGQSHHHPTRFLHCPSGRTIVLA